ncbi:Ups1p [Ascoidea rubescens DSM 1968]|uniref:MSF1-domain-containing protein n=1 Tax=Ascoidea rubescens DSM 1968 TaxID=1344418 RepID=A0A1D2VL19_9ASCO|nr:MSF1-domain-containing protein [Ascoidea rubescens DSM 1968]ODV62294.1 MSF1-domain-containing protein [Ascoidea rubescens DSM 1968]
MVLWYKNGNEYNYNFQTVSLAIYNKYPNPFSTHVLSVDTIENRIDSEGNLHRTRLIMKEGRLPIWAKPFLKNINRSWIIEKSIVNPQKKIMKLYTRNLDHTRILKIEEYSKYYFDSIIKKTIVKSQVKFSSTFKGLGIKDRIEKWSHKRFDDNIKKSSNGLLYVLKQLDEKTKKWKENYKISNTTQIQ